MSPPAVWRAHVRRIADASAHRPNRSMSRRASAFPAALHKLATVAGLCRLSERRSVHRRLLMQPAPAVAAIDWRQVAAFVVRIAMPRKSDVCVGLVAMVGMLCG